MQLDVRTEAHSQQLIESLDEADPLLLEKSDDCIDQYDTTYCVMPVLVSSVSTARIEGHNKAKRFNILLVALCPNTVLSLSNLLQAFARN
jgi:hypothetical protein